MPISTYVPKKMTEAPVASPSNPSVRFTAFDQAVMRKFAQTTKSATPSVVPQIARSTLVSLRNDTCVDPGVRPLPSAYRRARIPKVMPTAPWPRIFQRALSPSDRSRVILMTSSKNPTRPRPTMRNTTRSDDAWGVRPPMALPPSHPTTVAPMRTRPPIVGVPRLMWWEAGPSWRMNWPY